MDDTIYNDYSTMYLYSIYIYTITMYLYMYVYSTQKYQRPMLDIMRHDHDKTAPWPLLQPLLGEVPWSHDMESPMTVWTALGNFHASVQRFGPWHT